MILEQVCNKFQKFHNRLMLCHMLADVRFIGTLNISINLRSSNKGHNIILSTEEGQLG